ncbi:LacI family DNA-binding transcriptional regulator [Streptomyces sp. NPDC059590]|uniref:LacI family DNA-binding transcriptional regulator n=1 Tax=Streptomyces sp. NPDC059590 TaxID=3346877 RepID=UPI0036B86312
MSGHVTVSRAVNDKPEIDPATRQRVLRVAQAMGYRPSRFARGMVGPRITTLGLVIADVLDPFFPEVVSGVLAAADERGWQVAVYSTGSALEREAAVARTVVDHVDACVAFLLGPGAIELIHRSGMPFALLDNEHRPPAVSGGRIDFAAGMRQAVGHLVERGHRRIAMLDDRGRPDAGERGTRHSLFLRAAAELGLPADAGWVFPAVNSLDGGAAAMDDVLDTGFGATAVLAYNDRIAIGALRRARDRGVRVPADCAFVGCERADPQSAGGPAADDPAGRQGTPRPVRGAADRRADDRSRGARDGDRATPCGARVFLTSPSRGAADALGL